MMSRRDFNILMSFARAPNIGMMRAPAAELLSVRDAASWETGPADFELREILLKAAWKVLEKTGRAQMTWALALQGLLNAADTEAPAGGAELKLPDESWTRPRPDQGGD